jgi:hypothetical protein
MVRKLPAIQLSSSWGFTPKSFQSCVWARLAIELCYYLCSDICFPTNIVRFCAGEEIYIVHKTIDNAHTHIYAYPIIYTCLAYSVEVTTDVLLLMYTYPINISMLTLLLRLEC